MTGKLGNATIDGSGARGPNPDGFRVNTFGCQIAQVAVDPGTGVVTVERVVAVHDVGRIVNPLTASSQAEGGVLQGVGYALSEELVVDPTTGYPVNGHLDDYKVPTIADMPEIVVDFVERARREPPEPRCEGPRRTADRSDRRGDRERVRARDGAARVGASRSPGPRAGGARVSGYARPVSLDEALELMAREAPRRSRAAPTSPASSTAGSGRRRCSSTCATRASRRSRNGTAASASAPR